MRKSGIKIIFILSVLFSCAFAQSPSTSTLLKLHEIDKLITEADSLQQPGRVINLADSLYAESVKTGNYEFALKALSSKLRNSIAINRSIEISAINSFYEQINRLPSPALRAIGMLCFINELKQVFDHTTIEASYHEAINSLVDLLPELRKFKTSNYSDILQTGWLTSEIAPTLDLYIAFYIIDRANASNDIRVRVADYISYSTNEATVMYKKYQFLESADDYIYHKELMQLISQYRSIPSVGYLYDRVSLYNYKEKLALLNDYIKRFPNSPYTEYFQQVLKNLLKPEQYLTLQNQWCENEKVPFKLEYYNSRKLDLALSDNKTYTKLSYEVPSSDGFNSSSGFLPPLKSGKWNISVMPEKKDQKLYISNIASFQCNQKIYTVDFRSGKPLTDVFFYSYDENKKYESFFENGVIDLTPLGSYFHKNKYSYYYIRHKESESAPSQIALRKVNSFSGYSTRNESHIITDKPVYHLGDTVQFKFWGWQSKGYDARAIADQKYVVHLYSYGKFVKKIEYKSDQFGSFSGKIEIPRNGINNLYRLYVCKAEKPHIPSYITKASFLVESYKSPSFKIEIEPSKKVYAKNDTATITGKAISFDGIPLKKHKVDYKLIIKDYTWYYNNPKYTVSGDTLTDENGCFTITVNTSELSEYKTVQCQIIATITNQSGETQNKESCIFVTDDPHRINISGYDYYNIKDSCYHFVAYTSSFFSSSKQETGTWKLLNDKSNIVSEGTWSPGIKNKLHSTSGMNSGKYRLICELGNKSIKQKEIIFYNPHSGKIPVDSTLIVIPHKDNSIFVGTSEAKVYIRYFWQDSKGTTDEKWITLNNGLHKWNLPVVGKGEEARLTLITVKDCKIYSASHVIKNEIETDSIKIDIQTFRNHLTPGAKDEWTLLLTKNGKPLNAASTLAFMFDESLLSIGDFNPQLKVIKDTDYRFSGEFIPSASFNESTLSFIDESLVRKTYLNNDTYLHWNIKSNLRKANYYPYTRSIKYNINRFGYFWNECSPANLESDLIDNLMNKTARSNFTDCAFFYPNLPVNNDGTVTFSFTLPDLITTWRFVAITNNEKMEVGQVQQSFVASKDLMLQINEPRFLRQGDKTEVEATVSFLKSHSGTTKVTMELVDATTEKTITSAEKQVSGNDQVLKVTFPLAVPVNTDRIILRMQASNGNFSDGEQYLIPVLSPDIELTQTMELNTGGNSDTKFQWKELNLNSLVKSNSEFRIELVKNPAWYTVNALSAFLNPCSVSADALINAYFANTLGEAIARANPDIETYLIEKAKSPLIGKTVNTPWNYKEEQETKQTEDALLLYNPGQIEYLRSSAFSKLKKLQNKDGGFSWYPGMRSSVWQTLTVLQRMGELTELGVIEYGQTEKMMQIDALKYIDKFIADTYLNELKYKSTDKPLNSTQAQILYVRAMYMDIPLTGETLTGHKNWTSRASKSWIGNDLYTKSLLANALFAYGFTNDAKEIVTSILNYGVESPTLGFWFPSNQSDKLQTQVAMMRLMLNPQVNQPKRFEQMKWWLIAQKQNRMWPTSAATVDAVYALTMQGANVLNANGTLSVMLGNKELKSRDNMILSQNIPVPDLIAANGEIRVVNQTPLPVFGALYRTFLTPVKSVKGNNKGALQIQKEMIRNGNESLKVGEEVTVRLTVKSNQALDFVQIQDQLAACYQPVDQKSGYSWMQVACYKELTNENINFFIETLPRGTTVFEYKVWINRPGTYQSGVAKIESVYNPQFTNYSDNCELEVK